MACRHPRGTNGRPPPATRPPPRPPPHSTSHRRSPPRIAAVPHAVPRAVDQASASVLALRDRPVAASVLPSQLLVVKALRRPVESAQYTSAEFRALCDAHGAQQSMGKTGVCWDNALAESFFATYKLELIEPESWPTRARARTATVHWLEAVYNRQRRHSAIDMLSPVDYEERYWDRRAAA
ncbi:MAG: DDE-type integrase/transposase/recombinase [Deltaproteobacteria bacterium]|nr:MAG: DDE-type integrase/transposase/recombinase [Deltaproteobacteria bacterium]